MAGGMSLQKKAGVYRSAGYLIISPFHHHLTISPSYQHLIISLSHHLTISSSHHFITISPSHHLTISPSHHLTISPSHHLTISPSHLHLITISPPHHAHSTGPWRDNGERMLTVGLQCSVLQLLGAGYFHSDPHRGNLLQTPDGKLAYLDFGMMAEVPSGKRFALIGTVLGLVNKDVPMVLNNMQVEKCDDGVLTLRHSVIIDCYVVVAGPLRCLTITSSKHFCDRTSIAQRLSSSSTIIAQRFRSDFGANSQRSRRDRAAIRLRLWSDYGAIMERFGIRFCSDY
jgi:hypothetical protein